MSSYDKSRKAAGSSSEPLRQSNQRKSSSASQPKYKYERPPTSPYNNTADSLSYVPPLRTNHQSQGPSTSTRRMSSQHQARPQYHESHQVSNDDTSFRSARDVQSSKKSTTTTSVFLNDDDDEGDEESDESWDMLEPEAPNRKVSNPSHIPLHCRSLTRSRRPQPPTSPEPGPPPCTTPPWPPNLSAQQPTPTPPHSRNLESVKLAGASVQL